MYSYILLKYDMYQGNFTNPFVLRYDVENYGSPGGTFVLITYHLLLTTDHLLLITYYLSLITYYLLLIISFITPITARNSIVHSL